MQIRDFIIEKETKMLEDRLRRLIEIGAPEVVIEGQRKAVDDLKAGAFKVGGNAALLDCEFTHREVKKGRGGKAYIQFDGRINYFPNAKYGRYIAEA